MPFPVRYFLSISFFILFISCDRPQCENTNVIFDSNTPESFIYKTELEKNINQIGSDNLDYWLKSYKEKDGKDYLLVNVQNDTLCAIMQLTVTNWNELRDIREKKGVGRIGAKLGGLKYTIVTNARNHLHSVFFKVRNPFKIIGIMSSCFKNT